jgi:hypothetical protein
MKTTVDIPDPLFREAKEYAARHGIPLRDVFVNGLRNVVQAPASPPRRFRLKTVTTKGEGPATGDDWRKIRTLIYEGHGG